MNLFEIADLKLNEAVIGNVPFFWDWEPCAIRFYIGRSLVHRTNLGGRQIFIQAALQPDESVKWKVIMDSWVLGKDNQYYFEPMPSSVTKQFRELTRFSTREEALLQLLKHEKDNKEVIEKGQDIFLNL